MANPFQPFGIPGPLGMGDPERNSLSIEVKGQPVEGLTIGKNFNPLSLGSNGQLQDKLHSQASVSRLKSTNTTITRLSMRRAKSLLFCAKNPNKTIPTVCSMVKRTLNTLSSLLKN